MILQKESENKKEKENTNNITSKDNHQYQDVSLILIMNGKKKILLHVNQISIKTLSKKFRGDDRKKYQIFGAPIGNAKTSKKYIFNQKHQ